MDKQRSIFRLLRVGRHLVVKLGLSVALALLLATLLAGVTGGQAHAAAMDQRYTIVWGDTLSGIAARFGVSVSTLAAVNGIADPNVIYAGQTITIPGGGAPAPAPSSRPLSGSYESMIYQVFGQYGAQAVRVAMCESSMNPNAYNGILGAAGLFQIIPSTFASTSYAGQSVYNPAVNIRAAHEIFARDGYTWREWACKP